MRNQSVRGSGIYSTSDNRFSSPGLGWKSTKRDASKEEDRINRYISSKKMKFNTKSKKSVGRKVLTQEKDANAIGSKLDQMMIKSQKLYETYDSIGGEKLIQRVEDIDALYQRLEESTRLLAESNKLAFFLINFIKDFEQKLVYNPNLEETNISEIVKGMHKDYSCGILNFSVEEYEKVLQLNQSVIEDYHKKDSLNDIKLKLENLHSEFQNHRNKDFEGIKDLSSITGKDTSCFNTSISVNLTGNTILPEEKNPIVTSNIDLTGMGELILEEDNLLRPEIFEQATPVYAKKSLMRTSYSQLQSKVSIFEKNIAALLKSEAQLKGVINRLREERDGFKDLLYKQHEFKDMQECISNISSAILTHQSIGELKFNHQIMLKNLIDDDLRNRFNIPQEGN